MSIRRGNNVIASSNSNGLSLFDFKWSDHTISDSNWILSSSNSWHSGNTYKKMYNHLVNDWENGESSYEEINGTTVWFRIALDGHKIVINGDTPEHQTEAVEAIYTGTGVAWYYILDTTTHQFKLPRTKFGFNSGTPESVGNYIAPGLPNITGIIDCNANPDWTAAGAFSWGSTTDMDGQANATINSAPCVFDASSSNSIYGNSTTVQPPAVSMLLYFYTDQFESTGLPDTNAKDVVDDTLNSIRTNCITEIPQDIKLELNAGTLTLKAGSKVYVPNGFEQDGTTKKFDVRTIDSDTNVEPFNVNGQVFQFVFGNDTRVFSRNAPQVSSGSTAPTGQTYMVWYDTTNNLIKHTSDGGSTWSAGGDSFPTSIASTVSSSYTSIDQVFNGFGYIGKTIFALPGLKGLAPDGRNNDETLKNKQIVVQNVITAQILDYTNYHMPFGFSSNAFYYEGTLYIQEENPNKEYSLWYKPSENILYQSSTTTTFNKIDAFICGTFDRTLGVVSNMVRKHTFRALDYNDGSYISQCAMPSLKYIDLTLGASGTTYTAPANGWLDLRKSASDTQYFKITNTLEAAASSSGNNVISLFVPMKKGDTATLTYNATGTTHIYRFIYAEGEI